MPREQAGRWVELAEFGQMDLGAPAPLMLRAEHRAALCFYLSDTPDDWSGEEVHIRDASRDIAPMALVTFDRVVATRDFPTTADHGHPLMRGVFEQVVEVLGSEWAESLGAGAARHVVFSFHDTVVELLCERWAVTFVRSSASDLVPKMRVHILGN